MSDKIERSVRLFDAVSHEESMEVAESRALTEQALREHGINPDAALKALSQRVTQAIAAERRNSLKQAREQRLSTKRRSAAEQILNLPIESVVARLHQLQMQYPGQIQVGHRDLDTYSEEDLRSLLADFEDLLSDGT